MSCLYNMSDLTSCVERYLDAPNPDLYANLKVCQYDYLLPWIQHIYQSGHISIKIPRWQEYRSGRVYPKYRRIWKRRGKRIDLNKEPLEKFFLDHWSISPTIDFKIGHDAINGIIKEKDVFELLVNKIKQGNGRGSLISGSPSGEIESDPMGTRMFIRERDPWADYHRM